MITVKPGGQASMGVENQVDHGQHVMDAPLDLEVHLRMPKDWDGAQGLVYLYLHGVSARDHEALDFEVLPYEFKERLNLPS
ncbi:MAG: hypothetical protein LBL95_03880 [Deltaproteobacteria bacterium]|jgi:hypothetical protein|nr:hypothetical protein [Deltaproteobacteria bacterium]